MNQFIPTFFKIIILEKKNQDKNTYYNLIYLYSSIYFLKIYNKKEKIFFNKENNNLKIESKKLIDNKIINFKFLKLLKYLNMNYFFKIKFKGKGYKVIFKKNCRIIKFNFGFSHKKMIFIGKVLCNRINKYKFIIKYHKLPRLIESAKKITNIRKLNPYTKRGLRLGIQSFNKKKGSKGAWE